jgi:ABC-type Fe3+ transport system substrate-binding protein
MMNRIRFMVGAALVGVMVLLIAACGADDPTAVPAAEPTAAAPLTPLEKLIAAAEEEGELNILEGGFAEEAWLTKLETGLNAKYGTSIKINGTGGPSMSKMIGRLIEEAKAGQPPSSDLLQTSPRNRLRLQLAGVTEPVDWRAIDPSILPDEITHDGSGLVYSADAVGIVYNTNVFSPADLPQSLEDLADPKYKGLIATTPYGTGWAEAAVINGLENTEAVAIKIAPNIGGYTGSSDFSPITTGQIPMFAFTGSSGNALLEKERGAPIDVIYPFNAYFVYSVDMLKGSPHPNTARLLALFLRSPEGQKIVWEETHQDSPYLEGSNIYNQVKAAEAKGEHVLLEVESVVIANEEIYQKMVRRIIDVIKNQ